MYRHARVFRGSPGPVALISGDLIRIPNGSFLIEEGCSGLHFMIVGLAVAALHGELRRDPWRIRAAQLALMASLALLANWVRVYTIIEAGYLTDMRSYLVSVSHYWFGWGVFAVALVLFFGLTTLFGRAAPPEPAHGCRRCSGSHLPHRLRMLPSQDLAATVLVLVALPAVSWGVRTLQPAPALSAAPAPGARAPWSSAPSDALSSWWPVFPGADQEQRFAYTNTSGNVVDVFRVAYRTQRQGAKLIGMGTSVTGKRLRLRSEDVIDTARGAFREATVADPSGARSLIWYRYETAGRDLVKTASPRRCGTGSKRSCRIRRPPWLPIEQHAARAGVARMRAASCLSLLRVEPEGAARGGVLTSHTLLRPRPACLRRAPLLSDRLNF